MTKRQIFRGGRRKGTIASPSVGRGLAKGEKKDDRREKGEKGCQIGRTLSKRQACSKREKGEKAHKIRDRPKG